MEKRIGLASAQQKYRTFLAQDISFPNHIHRTYEVMYVLRGTFQTTVDNVEYSLRPGEGILIVPLQHHHFSVGKDTTVKIILFSADFIPEFDQERGNMLPVFPVFSPDTDLTDIQMSTPVLFVRASIYNICASILRQISFAPSAKAQSRNPVVEKILLYIDEHHGELCTLRQISDELKYEYSYLSKLFRKHMGTSYSEYLNNYRISKAQYLLIENRLSITEIANEVGYNSVRTFNREFQKTAECTPSAYRAKGNPLGRRGTSGIRPGCVSRTGAV